MAQQTAQSVTATPGRVHAFVAKGVAVAPLPVCANIVITRANAASMGLLATNTSSMGILATNTATMSMAVANTATMVMAVTNTATISISECG